MTSSLQLDRPLPLTPFCRPKVWGGHRLARLFGRQSPGGEPLGESWDLFHRPDQSSQVSRGPLQGRTLAALMAADPAALLGPGQADKADGLFPLAVKWLDVADRLSLQVHPGDVNLPEQEENLGKDEFWVVVEADPGATITCGLYDCAGPDELRRAMAEGRFEELLRPAPAAVGDLAWLPAGTVHAMGGGLVVYEVQRNADLTYRIHDWDRVGLDGKPRELHLEQACRVIDYGQPQDNPGPERVLWSGRELLVDSPHFRLEAMLVRDRALLGGQGSFLILSLASGKARLGSDLDLNSGQTVLVPAAAGPQEVIATGGECRLFVTRPGRGESHD